MGPLLGPLLGLALGGSGCMYAYEPLSGLHDPRVIDTGVANFTNLRLDIYCPPGDALDAAEAANLCRKVGTLFENQGADVSTASWDNRLRDLRQRGQETATNARKADLVLELRARDLTESNDPISWLLCGASFTLVPAVTESTFAQDVVIRDGTGFLLSSSTLRGRVIRRFGVGAWAGNKLLDLTLRDKEEELSGDVANRELSADLYQQLSQLVFNAAMRAHVLQQGPVVGSVSAP